MKIAAMVTAATLALLTGCAQPPVIAVSPGSVTQPVVTLNYQVADDLRSATGTESITFTPHSEMCEIVLRAWPNKPHLTRTGNGMAIDHVSVNGTPLEMRVESKGALRGAFGTLVEVRLPTCQAAGSPLQIDAEFSITLGPDTDERMGYSTDGELAWFQTAFPLLAWQNGVGWVRDAAVDMFGETVTNEAFTLEDLAVTAPTRFAVAGAGERGDTTVDGSRTTHHFSDPQMRDVSVMVGSFPTTEYRTGDVTVHLSVPTFSRLSDEAEWRSKVDESLQDLVDYLGPFPYDDLWVNVVPSLQDGVESSGVVQLGGRDRRVRTWLVTHELAHQWIYALVGNNQALHPWLDESVASMVQAVVDDPALSPSPSGDYEDEASEQIGRPMSFFAELPRPGRSYDEAVYSAGSDMLIRARDAGGHDAFDSALREYIEANAGRVATPQDFAAAFSGVPGVVDTLKEHSVLK